MDLTITVKLTPRASRNAIAGWIADANGGPVLKAGVTAVPEKGKANEALIALLSKEWKIPKSAIAIIRGETDRLKQVRITGLSPDTARALTAGESPTSARPSSS